MLSLLPLILMAVIVMGLSYLYWDLAVDQVRTWMDITSVMGWASTWLERMGLMNLKAVLPPLVIIFAVTPFVMIMALVAVSFMITPALFQIADFHTWTESWAVPCCKVWDGLCCPSLCP